jgi:lysyl-tRNA synthetase class 2
MPQVDSSAIDAIDYRPDKHELFVTFSTGRRYVYLGVPAAVYLRFKHADSIGRYFNHHIRDHYDFRELRS